jgi:hypothetical protein
MISHIIRFGMFLGASAIFVAAMGAAYARGGGGGGVPGGSGHASFVAPSSGIRAPTTGTINPGGGCKAGGCGARPGTGTIYTPGTGQGGGGGGRGHGTGGGYGGPR